ncbi:MAG: bifunctional adenosylcobinamide kinase/adenosylcobinamide-phosphate guanylyltransferase [Bacillota bacterium]|nr:bifunctional adenosylcobinamide kinase/adenosylcobinamide-phosphate guanylyltransferase [Bacillota bacterium]
MILIFGGAYQGKLEYARASFDAETVCDCSDGSMPDFTKDIIYGIDGFVLECARRGREAADFFRAAEDEWQDKILICTDVSQGVVPVDSVIRAFREMNGRLMLYLAAEADQVIRVFCGIGRREK